MSVLKVNRDNIYKSVKKVVDENIHIKVRVNPETSRLFQEAVFAAGGSWASKHESVGFTDTPFIFLDDGKLWHSAYVKGFMESRSTELVIEEVVQFKTPQDVFQYMFNGGMVRYNDGCMRNRIYHMVDGTLVYSYSDKLYECKESDLEFNEVNVTLYVPYIKPTEWYENIPKEGILCVVWDKNVKDSSIFQVTEYNPDWNYKFVSKFGGFMNARPATQDDVTKVMLKA